MFVMAKVFEELFTPTWNGLALSVSLICVFYASSFRPYIERLVATHANKTTRWYAKKPEESDSVSEVEHRHGDSAASV